MMADELDIEALLEAPFRRDDGYSKQEGDKTINLHSSERYYSRPDRGNSDKEKPHYEHHSRERSRSRSRPTSKSRSRSRTRRHYSKRYSKSPRSRSRSSDRHKRSRHHYAKSRSPSRSHYSHHSSNDRRASPPRKESPLLDRSPSPQPIAASLLTEAQRDRRTVFCRQLAQRLEPRQLKEFCEQAGKVRDVKIVYDKISRRSKGVAYVEFCDEESAPAAVVLTGKKLLGIPIIVEITETEKNRIAEEAAAALKLEKLNQKPVIIQLCLNNLHPSILELDLKRVFQPFGDIVGIQVNKVDSMRSAGSVQFRDVNDAKQAAERMNGFELVGRPIRIQLKEVETTSIAPANIGFFEEHDGTESLLRSARDTSALKNLASSRPSPCILLQHMYDPATETATDWESEIAEEVREECGKFGRIEHMHVPKSVDGDVFVRFASTDSAQVACSFLGGRWFGGRQIVANFIPSDEYLQRYPQ